MTERAKFRCDNVRKNNGMIEVHFTRREGSQDDVILANLHVEPDEYVIGQYYLIEIQPAFPH